MAATVASLHKKEISESFLGNLGDSFLEFMYRSFLKLDEFICFVAYENDKAVGFICGSENTSRLYREFLRTNFLAVLTKVSISMLKPSVFIGIIETLTYGRRRTNGDLPVAELISFAIQKPNRGQGTARALFVALVKTFEERKIDQFKVVVGVNLLAANAFYKKMGLKFVVETQIHSGKPSFIYVATIKGLLNDKVAERLK